MTLKSNIRDRVYNLMSDGRARSNAMICRELGSTSPSAVDAQTLKLVAEKYLRVTNPVAFAEQNAVRMFQLRVAKSSTSDNNPFEWRTYRQHESS